MGSVERRERIKKKVKEAILVEAKAIARQEGWASVSIRKIAQQIEYSPPVIYEYFENKDQLLETIREEGFDFLRLEFLHLAKVYQDAEKQLIEVAKCIWRFAQTYKETFQVMFNLEGAFCQSKKAFINAMSTEDNPVWAMLFQLRPRAASLVTKLYYEWWCFTFGFICQTITTQPSHALVQAEELYLEGVRRFLKSIA